MKTTLSKHLTRSVFFLFLALGAVSCSNDDDDPTPATSKGVEGSWNITSIPVSPAQNGISDLLPIINAAAGNDCLSRVTLIFKSGGAIDGTVPSGCTVDEDVVDDSSTWKVVGDKIQLTNSDGSVDEYDLTVNETEMRWSEKETDNGVTYTYGIVFKRK